MVWPLFLAVLVLPGKSAFLNVGVITSISIAVSIIASRYAGKISDGFRGRRLLRFSTVLNIAINLLRPFVSSYPGALAVNISYDVSSIGYRIPFLKGYFIEAYSSAEQRILFISITESLSSFIKMAVYCFLAIFAVFVSEKDLFTITFIVIGLSSLLIFTEKFKSLNPDKDKINA